MKDLFIHFDDLPREPLAILDKWTADGWDASYENCHKFKKEMEAVGFTFDYGLDGEGIELTPIIPDEIRTVLDDPKTLVACSHSGGKDSQAMLAYLRLLVPDDRLAIIHADLGRDCEWAGVQEHIRANSFGLPVHVTKARDKDGNDKEFFDLVARRYELNPDRPAWPSASCRQCTSDLKRGPIRREIRRLVKEGGYTSVVDCMGLRAQESPDRAKKVGWTTPKSLQIKSRAWHQWLPILDWPIEKVWETIEDARQAPHWAYSTGISRLSCKVCIMMSARDLAISAKHNPDTVAKYTAKEKEMGHSVFPPTKSKGVRFLDQIINDYKNQNK